MKYFTALLLMGITLAATAEEYAQPYSIKIQGEVTQGIVQEIGEVCRLSWKILDYNEVEIPKDFLSRNYRHFVIKITEARERGEEFMKQDICPIGEPKYSWEIQEVGKTTRFSVTVTAIPITNAVRKARGEFSLYTRYSRKLPVPKEFSACLTVLMDWNSKKGYCEHCSPLKAWEIAREACRWVRANVEAGIYNDYLVTMEKIESTELADLRIYCPVKNAQLKIGNFLIGFFRQWDAEKKMYLLHFSLPIDSNQAYRINISRGNAEYLFYHTHTAASEYVVEKLYREVSLTLITENMRSRAAVEGRPLSKLRTRHILQLYENKAQVVEVEIENGPRLKVLLNPKRPLSLKIQKQGHLFLLHDGKQSYDFVDKKVVLLGF